MKTTHAVGGLVALLISISPYQVYSDQPKSIISPNGDQYFSVNEDDPTDGELTYSTSQAPTPQCPDDTADGDPVYYWDFGPLDGQDNEDGTATIFTDVQACYKVTVYCEQDYVDGNGEDYTEDTQVSN